MNVNVVNGGRQAFNTMLYNVPDNNTLQWLNRSINYAKDALTGVADNLVDASVDLYNRVNSNSIINAAKALVSEQGGHANQYAIYSLDSNNMGDANYIMQQYIMANLEVQRLYQNNMCYGFEETYYNPEPDVFGKERLDYQRVMDGILYETETGLAVTHYSNGEDADELHVRDKHLILDTWAHTENMILNGIDPSDPDNNEL